MIQVANPIIGSEERAAVDRVLQSGMLAQGPEVAAFESEYSEVVNGRHCIAVNSGTSALHMSLLALGIGPGDEVIVPSFTFAATANAVSLTGATPVFADIEPTFFCLDPFAIEAAITSRTKMIMPVHLYGHSANMTSICSIAAKHGLLISEDAAQAHSATWNGVPVGALGDVASFSFYPTKNMTAGEGGMVTTNDASVARTVRLLRNQGMEKRYENEIIGFNTRMTDVHAAIGRVQLQKLPTWTAKRQANAQFLSENIRGVITPAVAPEATHSYHQYTIRIEGIDRDLFAEQLTSRGIGNGVYYPIPVHRLPSFGLTLDLPSTELVARQCLSLPVHPTLTQNDLEKIVEVVNDVASAGA
jgi:dTDP-4-amino-4,6-dideoxygalactose transaminase